MKIDPKDVTIDTFTNNSPDVSMRLTHKPAGFVIEGSGESRLILKKQLSKMLEKMVSEWELSGRKATGVINLTDDKVVIGLPKIETVAFTVCAGDHMFSIPGESTITLPPDDRAWKIRF